MSNDNRKDRRRRVREAVDRKTVHRAKALIADKQVVDDRLEKSLAEIQTLTGQCKELQMQEQEIQSTLAAAIAEAQLADGKEIAAKNTIGKLRIDLIGAEANASKLTDDLIAANRDLAEIKKLDGDARSLRKRLRDRSVQLQTANSRICKLQKENSTSC